MHSFIYFAPIKAAAVILVIVATIVVVVVVRAAIAASITIVQDILNELLE